MGHSKFINYEFVFGFHLPTVRLVDETQFIYLKVQRRVSALFKCCNFSKSLPTVTVLNKLDQDNSK